jgi:hypothetical protein
MLFLLDHPRFADRPAFLPSVSPKVMLKMGIFGGHYFGAKDSEKFATHAADLPPEWFDCAALCDDYNKRNNHFGVKAGNDYDWWFSMGLMHPADPLGWFHWYCRFYAGRRHPDDDRQISRWLKFRRWEKNILNSVPGQIDKRPVVRQSLLHWAYNPFI